MRRPRALIVTTEFPPGPGGIGTHAGEAARWLTEYGWEVRVRACQDYTERPGAEEFCRKANYEVRSLKAARLPGVRLPYLAAGAWADLRRWAPDVVTATGRNAVLAAAFTGRKAAKLATVAHGTELLGGGWRQAAMLRALARADVVVAVSRFTAAKLREIGVTLARVEVIPNGADGEVFRPAAEGEAEGIRKELGLGSGPAVLTVGHVSERKGQWVVAHALGEVVRRIPDVEYWVAGLPTERGRVEEAARAAGARDRVRFLGRLSREMLVRVMQACDVFAMTSVMTANGDYEGYGIAVMEAALCGKPAVVSDCGGLPEAVIDGETGLVVRERDAGATARALVRLLEDAELRRRMGERARERASAEGTWAQRMRAYDRLLRELAEEGR